MPAEQPTESDNLETTQSTCVTMVEQKLSLYILLRRNQQRTSLVASSESNPPYERLMLIQNTSVHQCEHHFKSAYAAPETSEPTEQLPSALPAFG